MFFVVVVVSFQQIIDKKQVWRSGDPEEEEANVFVLQSVQFGEVSWIEEKFTRNEKPFFFLFFCVDEGIKKTWLSSSLILTFFVLSKKKKEEKLLSD